MLEETELLAGGSEDLVLLDLEDVEANSLGEGTALACSDDVALLDLEGGRAVDGGVGVALLETVVLLDVVQVVATDDDGPGEKAWHTLLQRAQGTGHTAIRRRWWRDGGGLFKDANEALQAGFTRDDFFRCIEQDAPEVPC